MKKTKDIICCPWSLFSFVTIPLFPSQMLISPNVAIAIFGLILVISGIMAWVMKTYKRYDTSSFHTFIAILAGLGVFVTFMFYYNLVELQQQQQSLLSIQELAKINGSMNQEVLKIVQKSSKIIPNFISSITPLTNKACCGEVICSPDPVNVETCTQKMIIAYAIFSLWRNVITSCKFVESSMSNYIADFLQRANSPQLYKEWKAIYLDFDLKTQQFGDLLFEHGLAITEQTTDSYVNASSKMMKDERFVKLIRID